MDWSRLADWDWYQQRCERSNSAAGTLVPIPICHPTCKYMLCNMAYTCASIVLFCILVSGLVFLLVLAAVLPCGLSWVCSLLAICKASPATGKQTQFNRLGKMNLTLPRLSIVAEFVIVLALGLFAGRVACTASCRH